MSLGIFTVLLLPVPVLLRAFSVDHASTSRRPLSTSTLGAATVAVTSLAQVRPVTDPIDAAVEQTQNATVTHFYLTSFYASGSEEDTTASARRNFCGRALLLLSPGHRERRREAVGGAADGCRRARLQGAKLPHVI